MLFKILFQNPINFKDSTTEYVFTYYGRTILPITMKLDMMVESINLKFLN